MNLWFALARIGAVLLSSSILALSTSEPALPETIATFSRPPNYELTKDPRDAEQLFDGHLSSGTMWTSRDSVGWIADQRPIDIAADLGTSRPVGSVCVRSARNQNAQVSYPARIDVFTSTDGKRFGWRGDAVGGQSAAGPYEARWFCTPQFDRQVRFVTLVVRSQGKYFFSDEVEARPMPDGAAAAAGGDDVIPVSDIQTFVVEREAVAQAADDLAHMAGQSRTAGATDAAGIGRTAGAALTPAALDRARTALYRACPALAAPGLRLVRVAPYQESGPFCAETLRGPGIVRLAPGWHRAASLWISNGGSQPAAVRLTAGLNGPAASGVKVRLLGMQSVLAAPARLVADPLVPLTDGGVTIPAGEGRQIWVDIQAAADAGAGDAVLTISGTGMEALRIPVQVVPLPEGTSPTTTVWGYLDSRPIRTRPQEAVRDMLDHGATNAVLPAGSLPWPAAAGGAQIGDYGRFDAAMAALKGHRSFLFYLGLNDPSKAAANLDANLFSPAWQQRFVAWIREWSAHLRSSGLQYDDFAMYPIDEPGTEAMRDRLVQLSRLIKSADPRIRVYTTLHKPDMLNDDLIRAVDIVQLNGPALTPDTAARLQRAGKTVWLYETEGGGKAADPARFYRAQGWHAYLLGMDGFGFWAYADAGRSGSVWDDFDDIRPDFAVIYDRPDGLLSSRRWEAWREGVEDYRLLAAAERAAGAGGRARVRQLAAQGLQAIGDPEQLDEVIGALLQIASGKPLNSADRSVMSGAAQGRVGRN